MNSAWIITFLPITLIILILATIFLKIERYRRQRSVFVYYIKPGIIGGIIGIIAFAIRIGFAAIISFLVSGKENFQSIVKEIVNFKTIFFVLIIFIFLGILVGVSLQNKQR